jgi:hypothetical protein
MELDATEWCAGRRCVAHRRYEPRQGPRQANGAQPQTRGASTGGGGQDPSANGGAQHEGAAWEESGIQMLQYM